MPIVFRFLHILGTYHITILIEDILRLEKLKLDAWWHFTECHLQPDSIIQDDQSYSVHCCVRCLKIQSIALTDILSYDLVTLEGLTEEPSGKSDSGTVKQRKMSKKNTEEEPKARALMSTNSDRWLSCERRIKSLHVKERVAGSRPQLFDVSQNNPSCLKWTWPHRCTSVAMKHLYLHKHHTSIWGNRKDVDLTSPSVCLAHANTIVHHYEQL